MPTKAGKKSGKKSPKTKTKKTSKSTKQGASKPQACPKNKLTVDCRGAPSEGICLPTPAERAEMAEFQIDIINPDHRVSDRGIPLCQAPTKSGELCKRESAVGTILHTRYGNYSMCSQHLKTFTCACAYKGLKWLSERHLDDAEYFAMYPEWGDEMMKDYK